MVGVLARRGRVVGVVLIVVACCLIGMLAASAAQADGTYVALGDSVAAPPDSYVSILFGSLRTPEGGGLDALYNRARGGDDSTTLRTGGQLASAIADIDAPSDTKVVTIDIGGNDRSVCGGTSPTWHLPSCPFAANFDATLADLQAELGRDPGPESLIAMNYYNPASGTGTAQEQGYDLGLLGTDLLVSCVPSGDPRLGLNDQIVCISGARGALVADVYPPFKSGGQALMSGDGLHPNSQGQGVIAAEFRKALGLTGTPAAPSGGGATGGGGSQTGGGATQPPVTVPGAGAVDTSAPVVAASFKAQKLAAVLKKGLAVTLAANEPATFNVELSLDRKLAKKLKLKPRVGTGTATLTAAGNQKVTVKPSATARRKLAKQHRLKLTLSLRATDTAGNSSTTTKIVTVRR